MNIVRQYQNTQVVSGIGELIKGQEQEFLGELQPFVRRQSVRLDLSRVERIDAAGLSALVSLYCDASKAGHEFAVVNPTARVARILAIVGLDRILLAADSQDVLPPAPVELAAA